MDRFVDPKFLRLSTIVSEISYKLDSDTETDGSYFLPDARKIGYGRRALTGLMTGAHKTPGNGAFESALERDLFVLLEFDRHVIAWHPQPFTIPVPKGEGRRASRYTPDVVVEYSASAGGSTLASVDLCEVKYRQELRDDWAKLKPRLKTGLRHAKSQGWNFKIYTEVEIRTPRLTNAKFFLGYVKRGTDFMDIARLQTTLEELGTGSPNEIFRAAFVTPEEKGRMLGVLWHMVAIGRVSMDFDQPLSMQTPMWCDEKPAEY